MKKNLRYVLGSTSLLAFAIPVISMVSCGDATNDSKKNATYDVTINTDAGFTWKGSNTAKSNEQYKGTITYKDGYQFDSIAITIDKIPVEKPESYLNSGKTELTIPANKITGKIVITISTKSAVIKYKVTVNKNESFTWKGDAEAVKNQDYTGTIEYKENYVLNSIKITIGGNQLENPENYFIDENKNKLTIPAAKITGDITIEVTTKTTVKTFNVTFQCEYCKGEGETTASSDKDYIATIKYDDGYEFGDIIVNVGNDTYNDAKHLFDDETKTKLTIPAETITGDITIKITAKVKKSS